MRTPRSIPLVLAAALSATAATGASAATRHDRCVHRDTSTVALTKVQRVYVDETGSYFACVRKTGRSTELFTADNLYTSGTIRAVNGYFVAYEWSEVPACKADCPPGVDGTDDTMVTDARTGKARTLGDGSVRGIQLLASGTVGFVVYSASVGAELAVWPATGARRLLDTGRITAVRSTAGRIHWKNGSEAKSAAFA
jgi:hypothetical protein